MLQWLFTKLFGWLFRADEDEETTEHDPYRHFFEDDGKYHRPFPDSVHISIEPDSTTHTGRDLWAIDFLVPEGTPVLCPRNGEIIAVKSDSDAGGADEKFADDANHIVIAHDGGESSVLIHLQKDSALVKVGDFVFRGHIIAKQGSTGWTYAPHIHFAVFKNGKTIPVRFAERIVLP